jgi:hypothetical protein
MWKAVVHEERTESIEYTRYLNQGLGDMQVVKEISKDVNRTYGKHPYFKDSMYGKIG